LGAGQWTAFLIGVGSMLAAGAVASAILLYQSTKPAELAELTPINRTS
jgi:hypothetical protein